jgi:hypothetical protein
MRAPASFVIASVAMTLSASASADPTQKMGALGPGADFLRPESAARQLSTGQVLAIEGFNVVKIEPFTKPVWTVSKVSLPSTVNTLGRTLVESPAGKALLIGGAGAVSYDPKADALGTPHLRTKATDFALSIALADGRVLVACGAPAGAWTHPWPVSAAVYDPKTEAWTEVAAPKFCSGFAQVARLDDGRVLFAGGEDATGPIARAQLYDPGKDAWTETSPMNAARADLTLTTIDKGRVMAVGGIGVDGKALGTMEVFDQATSKWTVAATLARPRASHTATWASAEGLLVIAGGSPQARNAAGREALASLELYSTLDDKLYPETVKLAQARMNHAAALLGGRRVLFVGGSATSGYANQTELWNVGDAGAECAGAYECAAAFCADGVCCDAKCDGQCEACNIKGLVGKCSAVAGAPVGSRPTCGAGTTACNAPTCDGTKDRAKCAGFPGTTVSCGAARCDRAKAEYWGTPTCDGLGACQTVTPSKCGRYRCDDGGCLTTCKTDDDCSDGFRCDGDTCITRKARCLDDTTSESIPPDGSAPLKSSCLPYRCDVTGECLRTCATTADCAGSATCDATNRTCVLPSVGPTTDGSGCAMGRRGSTATGALVLAVCVLARRRRRR